MILFAGFRRQEREFFIFGSFCICYSFRAFFAEPFLYNLTLLTIPFRLGIMLEYLFTYLSLLLLVFLVYTWFKQQFSKFIFLGLVAIIEVAMVVTVFSNPLIMQRLSTVAFVCVVFGEFYLLNILIRHFHKNNLHDHANAVGLILVMLGMLNDYLVNQGWIDSNLISLSLVAVWIYVVIQVFLMSKSYADKVRETEALNLSLIELNSTLDEQVNLRTKELREANERLEYQASRDSLTGIYNRHRFNSYIKQAFKNAKNNNTHLAIIMFDIDEFKKYNDHYGHIQGDLLLRRIVKIAEQKLPSNSLFARYGGEEFIIVLPDHNLEQAFQVAENVRTAIAEAELPHCKRENGIATISVGVAALHHHQVYESEVELVDAADQQLYHSKHKGRNATSVAD